MKILGRFKQQLFKIIYRIYLWSSEDEKCITSERIVEYPFVIKNIVKKVSIGSKILVIGCAGDPLTTIFPSLDYQTWGLDLKYLPIKYDNLTLVKEDIRKTSFPNDFFDVVVAVSVLEHVGRFDDDLNGDKKALIEIKRITKQNGKIILTMPIANEFRYEQYQRVYDHKSVLSLLKDFEIQILEKYYNDEKGFWIRITSKENNEGMIVGKNGVVLIIATNIKK